MSLRVSKEEFVKRKFEAIRRLPLFPTNSWSEFKEQLIEKAEEDYDHLRELGLILVDEAELRKVIAELNCASCDLRFDKPLPSYCQKCVTAYQKLESLIKEAS